MADKSSSQKNKIHRKTEYRLRKKRQASQDQIRQIQGVQDEELELFGRRDFTGEWDTIHGDDYEMPLELDNSEKPTCPEDERVSLQNNDGAAEALPYSCTESPTSTTTNSNSTEIAMELLQLQGICDDEMVSLNMTTSTLNFNEVTLDVEDYHDCMENLIPEEEIYWDADLYDQCSEQSVDDDRLAEILESEEWNEPVCVPFAASKAEIMLAVLKYSLKNTLSLTATADLLKMLNSFFVRSFLPDSPYFLKEYFGCTLNADLYALCPNCKVIVRKFELGEHHVHCNLCNQDIIVSDPSFNNFFAVLDCDDQIAGQLEKNSGYYLGVINKQSSNGTIFRDLTDGMLYEHFLSTLSPEDRKKYGTGLFNNDSAPVFETSKYSITPYQFVINETPQDVRASSPITAAIYFGKDKPEESAFSKAFVDKANKLSTEGVKCKINGEEMNIKIFFLCACMDSVARAPAQGITQYNGKCGCNWCLNPGIWVKPEEEKKKKGKKARKKEKGGSRKYVMADEPAELRTKEKTIKTMHKVALRMNEDGPEANEPIDGVKKPSMLLALIKFNIILGMVPDYMHAVNLGIGKQFAKMWIDMRGMPFSLPPRAVDVIDQMMANIKVPNQLYRLSRSFKYRQWWTAREWENWILYYSVPVLSAMPEFEVYLEHWTLLVTALHLLLQNEITRAEVDRADALLRAFVAQTEQLYGKEAMTYNVHQLLHLAQSVLNWGPLWAHSGYPFENGIGILVKNIQSPRGVIHQLTRVLNFTQAVRVMEERIRPTPYSSVMKFVSHLHRRVAKVSKKFFDIRYFGYKTQVPDQWIERLRMSGESWMYHKMVKEKCLYDSDRQTRSRSNNSFALTKDGRYVRLLDFIVDESMGKEVTICNLVTVRHFNDESMFRMQKIVSISPVTSVIETGFIDRVCVVIDIKDDRFICPVPHLYSY